MVSKALRQSQHLDDARYVLYVKGSYKNKTNVRADSDVDIAIEFQGCSYYGAPEGAREEYRPSPYNGSWNPEKWRNALNLSLIENFGTAVDTSGRVAIQIAEVPGSRPSTDVVPSYAYKQYTDTRYSRANEGACVFPSDGGPKIINWPQQQYENGIRLNSQTRRRYKHLVRILKRAENVLANKDQIPELPSYFMECLIYNGSTDAMVRDDLEVAVKETLASVYRKLDSSPQSMVEPNEMKMLFNAGSAWTPDEGKVLIVRTMQLLELIK